MQRKPLFLCLAIKASLQQSVQCILEPFCESQMAFLGKMHTVMGKPNVPRSRIREGDAQLMSCRIKTSCQLVGFFHCFRIIYPSTRHHWRRRYQQNLGGFRRSWQDRPQKSLHPLSTDLSGGALE